MSATKIPVGQCQDKNHEMDTEQAMYNLRNLADDQEIAVRFDGDGWKLRLFRAGREYEVRARWLADALTRLWRDLHAVPERDRRTDG